MIPDNARESFLKHQTNSSKSHVNDSVHGAVSSNGIYVAHQKVGVIHEESELEISRSPSKATSPRKDSIRRKEEERISHESERGEQKQQRTEVEEEEEDDPLHDQLVEMLTGSGSSLLEAGNDLSAESGSNTGFHWWDARRRRRRYDCKWKAWEEWSKCTVECGSGETKRYRQTDGPHWGGQTCSYAGNSQNAEYKLCNTQNCPVGCEWNHWGAWGPCTKTCGTGARVRQRGALPFSNRDGGTACDMTKSKKSGTCNTWPCPIPCAFEEWNYWGGCSQTCGTGTKTRKRRQNGPEHGGAPCEEAAFLNEHCNAFSCPIDCAWNEWGGWGGCTKTCGGGVKLRERAYLSQASNGGKACPGAPAEILACNIEECAQDCKWGEWHPPSACTKTCGGGSFRRHRPQELWAEFGGKECTGPNTEIGPCNVEPCAVDCLWDDWSSFNECSASCGGGTHTAKRNGTDPEYGGAECGESNMTKEEECNVQVCPAIMVKGTAFQATRLHGAALLGATALPLLTLWHA
jgi:hypothetical protein